MKEYLPYVNVFQGTNSTPEFSHGNVLPLCARPFGMNAFAVETRGHSHTLFFNPNDSFTTGIRLTHAPSPWISDYATFTIAPSSGDRNGAEIDGRQRSGYTLRRTVCTPYEIDLRLMVHRASIRLVPTVRGAAFSLSWDDIDATRRFVLTNRDAECKIHILPEKRRIVGYTRSHTWPCKPQFAMYYVIEFDTDFDMSKTVVKAPNGEALDSTAENIGKHICLNLAFAGRPNAVNARLATSFVSDGQAEINLENELVGKDFDTILADAKADWERRLSKIEIDADEEVMRTFYSCLYRMMLFPRIFHEFDREGRQIHYSPALGSVCEGPMYTDNGFWDTYKTVYPLYSIIMSDEYSDMCAAFCNFFDEAGWLPRWMSPGAVNCMPGTAIDAVFGDAVAKGVVKERGLIGRMYKSTMKHVLYPSPTAEYGRDGIDSFNSLGYVSSNYHESVNKTLDYAYGNFCVAQMAKALGDDENYEFLMKTAENYKNIWDNDVGFMRAKNEKGEMRSDWNNIQWGGDYTEGSAWQNSFAVYQDFLGLSKIMGGREKLVEKMDDLFSEKPYYDTYGYGGEIHEMLEMAAVDFGQCALSNQPSFHIPYIYSCMGRPEKTAFWVRRALKELFNSTINGYPGDEDNGSMAGFYVFGALGFYPVCPGVGEYVVGSPAVRHAVIHTDAGTDFVIDAEKNSDERIYVRAMSYNGSPLHRTFIKHDEIKAGGRLTFDMTDECVSETYSDAELPYSIEKDA